jgi:hypothetical protein
MTRSFDVEDRESTFNHGAECRENISALSRGGDFSLDIPHVPSRQGPIKRRKSGRSKRLRLVFRSQNSLTYQAAIGLPVYVHWNGRASSL